MAQAKAIQTKIKTVSNIKKVTSAMEMIARVKMKKAIDGVLSVRPYAFYASELLANLSQDQILDSAFLRPGKGSKLLLVVIGADKGLCGAYNANVGRSLKQFEEDLNVKRLSGLEVIAIGKKAAQEAQRYKIPVLKEFSELSDNPKAKDVDEVAHMVREQFLSGQYRRVHILYTDYVSSFSQQVRSRVLLPIVSEEIYSLLKEASFEEEKEEKLSGAALARYILEPDPAAIFDSVVPRLIDIMILHALLESRASEESMRMFAMKNASESAQDLQDDLTRVFNRARQASITQEIAEIAAGAEALR
ncbi:MAG: ATP synthase F1 subunit gamma [Candidatus Harrisonbacteria bacterium]|nr:ATP synthase F1 subunit gamma [Candidatus Harrisonbacteria bacterium]